MVRPHASYPLPDPAAIPREAMVEDLLFLRAVIAAARIDYLLIQGADRRPVIAIDQADRAVFAAALADAGARQPVHCAVVDAKIPHAIVLADAAFALSPEARIFRVFRPRAQRNDGLRHEQEAGVQIQLWSFTADTIVLPIPNALTRNAIPAREAVRTTVERYGHTWPTLQHMFTAHAGDVTFDIDLVFSWVDGADLQWQRQRAEAMAGHVHGAGDDSAARFRHVDELRYALRSVHMYAPWIRQIYVATDCARPHWLADDDRVRFVRSAEFFADPAALPTYNSQAVESQLHRIPGLSEHFIYANDDMFFGQPVGPETFFSPGGITKFIEDDTRIGLGSPEEDRSGFENSARVNRRLLHHRYGAVITRHLAHAPTPLRKSVVTEMETEFPDEFAATAASPFRARDNISVTNSLYHYYALLSGRAVVQQGAQTRYVDTTAKAGLREMKTLLKQRSVDFFCLNDDADEEVSPRKRAKAMTKFLRSYFPIPAPWERPDPEIG
ncbi:stealth family protein [[Mycobacterium] burgundiense]|uniref:Stealth family protein n=1 Tax=[Mycobacterium] burgundiense TaxID=3064286 RepID=A0ABN9N5V6_9MYCO|nr:stealth family protein [Mycolicibacterium sp. MU0053]CAJ1500981.1 stealth family protein [Mycolicibacterium sp. MU0053]